MRFATLLLMTTTAFGFSPTPKPPVSNFRYVGNIAPTGYFDPLDISSNLDDNMIKYVREAELQHARVAMVAFLAMTAIDFTQPERAIDYIYKMPVVEQLPFWLSIGAYEFARMGAGWKNPFVGRNAYFKLEDEYQPGNVLKLPTSSYSDLEMNQELANGRLAMFASLGYMAQELAQNTKILG